MGDALEIGIGVCELPTDSVRAHDLVDTACSLVHLRAVVFVVQTPEKDSALREPLHVLNRLGLVLVPEIRAGTPANELDTAAIGTLRVDDPFRVCAGWLPYQGVVEIANPVLAEDAYVIPPVIVGSTQKQGHFPFRREVDLRFDLVAG